MNAAAITIVAALRKPVMSLFFDKEEYDEFVPGIYTSGGPFVRFTFFIVFLHLTILFFIESFTLFNLMTTFLRIVTSAAITILLIITMDSLMYRRKASEHT
jgi:hypothetical protein